MQVLQLMDELVECATVSCILATLHMVIFPTLGSYY